MPKISAYHRPQKISEVLKLLARPGVTTTVIAGGTYLNPHLPEMVEEVVDLQLVGLADIIVSNQSARLGAMVSLQAIVEDTQLPSLLRQAAHREGPNTFRYAGTVGGAIAGPSKESEFVAALLVLDAQVEIETLNGSKTVTLIDFLQDIPTALSGGVITAVSISTEGETAAGRVARTPADNPIVAALARRTPAEKINLALCGVAPTPVLVDPNTDIKAAINPSADFRGSMEYRRQMAAVLTKRVLSELEI